MNIQVALYFLSNAIVTLIVGGKFATKNKKSFKAFGVALIIDAFAFVLWTIGYLNQATLLTMITAGAIALLVSFLFFFRVPLYEEMSSKTRTNISILGAIALFVIFIIGKYSSNYAFVSTEGFLFFNLTPLVQMLYIFALIISVVPAVNLVASKFNGRYSSLILYGFLVQVAGGIMLITSTDVYTLYIVGWVIGIVNFILGGSLLLSKKIWQNVD